LVYDYLVNLIEKQNIDIYEEDYGNNTDEFYNKLLKLNGYLIDGMAGIGKSYCESKMVSLCEDKKRIYIISKILQERCM
jgi:hypothetical protein